MNQKRASELGLGSWSAQWNATTNLIVVKPNAPVPKGFHWVIDKASAIAAVASSAVPNNDIIATGFWLIPNLVDFANFSTGINDGPITHLNEAAPVKIFANCDFGGTFWQGLNSAGWFGTSIVTDIPEIIVPGGWTIAAVFMFSNSPPVTVTQGVGYLNLLYSVEKDC